MENFSVTWRPEEKDYEILDSLVHLCIQLLTAKVEKSKAD